MVADQCSACLETQQVLRPMGRMSQLRPRHFLEQHPGFVAEDQPLDCGKCIQAHAEKFQFPPLEAGNVQAWELYMQFQGQQRVGFSGATGLDANVLRLGFHCYRIPMRDRRLLLQKILLLDHEMTAHYAKKAEMERQRRELEAKAGSHMRRVDV